MQKAVTVTVRRPSEPAGLAAEHAKELTDLLNTIDISVEREFLVTLKEPSPRFLLGEGKTREITEAAADLEAEFIVFDDDLSPSQQRNWEALSGLCVIDRQEVILEIFADRAFTREAVLQVGLARLQYSLPRLTRAWTHLSRQRGGRRGTKGEGETQLEIDRRVVLRKISRYKEELKTVSSQRAVMRKKRQGVPVPTGSLVGYTNAGKSSLLNALSGSSLYAEDKLFATLDPTTRRVALPGGREVLLTDTVGFIRKLPHALGEAGRAPLADTVISDFLIQVVDAASPEALRHCEATRAVLREIGAEEKPILTVLNKTDLEGDPFSASALRLRYPDAIEVSALTGAGLEDLAAAIETVTAPSENPVSFVLPSSRYDLLALVKRTGKVLEESYENGQILVSALVTDKTKNLLNQYISV